MLFILFYFILFDIPWKWCSRASDIVTTEH